MANLEQSSSTVKPILMGLWLLAVGIVIYFIQAQDQFFAKSVPTVAEVVKPRGSVMYRSENKVRWNDTTNGTLLSDGDRVSTGRGSSVVVLFKDGRRLSLGEESQVVISTITHPDNGITFLANLVKGSVIADSKNNCDNCRDIILRSGSDSFNIGMGKREGYFRDHIADKVERFNVNGPIPVLENDSDQQEPVKEEVKPETVVETPKIEKKKSPPLAAKGYEFNVRPPVEGMNLWTHRSLAALYGARITIPVTPPSKEVKSKSYVPIIEVSNLDGTKSEIIAGNSSTDRSLSLPIVKLRLLATQKWAGVKQYSVSVRGGIRILDGKKPLDSVSGQSITIQINSLGEPLGTPLALGFDQLKFENPQSNWIPAKMIIPVSSAPIQVVLFGAGDFAKLLPFAAGSNRFGSLTSSQTNQSVANIVRDGYIVAQVTKYTSTNDVRTLLKSLRGDFAFVGPKSLYQYSSGKAQDNVVTIVNDLLDKGKVLYFYKNKSLYPVSRSFIKTSEEVANFLKKQASMFFTEKVEIIN